jgi:hypothetical protein
MNIMAKELPYFKFEPAEYLTKDISFCSISAQGLFINICSYYWQRQCSLTLEQISRRFNYPNELNELIKEGIIDVTENNVKIKFLDIQLDDVSRLSNKNSANGSKGGRPKKNPNETQTKPNLNPTESQTKGIREEEIKEDNMIKNEIFLRKKNFANQLADYVGKYSKDMLNEFYLYWTEHGTNDKKMRFEKQTSFDVSRRLNNWLKNSVKFDTKESVNDDYMNHVMKQINLNK